MLRKWIYLTLFSFVLPQGYNMELVSFMDFGQNVSDITGFYQDGREFAVVGLQNAASFVDITDPSNPVELGRCMYDLATFLRLENSLFFL